MTFNVTYHPANSPTINATRYSHLETEHYQFLTFQQQCISGSGRIDTYCEFVGWSDNDLRSCTDM